MQHTARSRSYRSYRSLGRTGILTAGLVVLATFVIPGQALADHPDRDQMDRVQEIAHELEQAARATVRSAERSASRHGWGHNGRYDRRHRRTDPALYDLLESADHFHAQVERYRQNPYHTEADYEKLWRAYREARYALERLHSSAAWDHFRDVERLIYGLDRYYGGRYAGGYGGYGNGGYGNGGYGHSDYDYGTYDRHGDHGDHGYCNHRNHVNDRRYRPYGEYRRDGQYRRGAVEIRRPGVSIRVGWP